MGRPLEEYERKRDFGRTPEPTPRPRARRGPPVFVVHRHEARRLHYDLRLEMDGVLCSWAVPKGFSYAPADKHLAVRTEDHPLEYEHFDGVIPKGQYGAGTMTIWDRGRYEVLPASSIEKGELKVVLHGRRLRGEWHLVKTKQGEKHWLLFKSRDRYAREERDSGLGVELERAVQRPLPRSVKPMEPGGRRAPFSDPGWLFEMRFVGRRALAEKRGDALRLRGWKRAPPEVEAGLRELRCTDALLDGVVVALDGDGRPSAERLEARLAGRGDDPLAYYAFDLLHYDEFDLRPLPTVDRKGALRAVLPRAAPGLLFVDHVAGDGVGLAAAVTAAGLPGAIAKRAEAPYAAGASSDWLEIELGAEAPEPRGDVARSLAAVQRERPTTRAKLTNPGKVFWPAEGFTKGDLIAYYDRVSEWLLPHLAERPIHMKRYPDGIEGKSFYQRRAKEDAPEWVETVLVESDRHEGPVPHMICNDRDTLLWLANQGSIDLHPWMSRRATPDSPDWCVIDLDPKGAPFAHVVRLARAVGKLLRGIGLRPLLKTSGSTGLHVYVPLRPGYTYEHSRMFGEMVARVVAREHADVATVERHVDSREGRVYLDYLQNARGQTIVPPYSVRPVRGARVSTPLRWDELEGDLDPARFTIQTVIPRVEREGDLFRPVLTDGQDLLPAIQALEQALS